MNQVEPHFFCCKIGETETDLIAYFAVPNLPAICITEADINNRTFQVEFRLSTLEFAMHQASGKQWSETIKQAVNLFLERQFPLRLAGLKTNTGEVRSFVESF